jgi:hypothetical protein
MACVDLEGILDPPYGICGIEEMNKVKMTHSQLEFVEYKNEQSKVTKK